MTPRAPGDRPRSTFLMLWSVLIVLTSVAGGLAAAGLVNLPSLWIAVAIPAVIGSAIAPAALYLTPGLTEERDRGPGGAESGPLPRPDVPYSRQDRHLGAGGPVPARASAEPPAVVQVLPVPARPAADTPWWAAAQATPPPARGDASLVPTPDLSSYLALALIAQCPRCGAFRLDIRRAPAHWACRCEACEHTWTWQPGTAWPEVRVAPRRRTQPANPDPDSRNSAR